MALVALSFWVEDLVLILLLTSVVLATSSAFVVSQSVADNDADSAWTWTAVFFLASLVGALMFLWMG